MMTILNFIAVMVLLLTTIMISRDFRKRKESYESQIQDLKKENIDLKIVIKQLKKERVLK